MAIVAKYDQRYMHIQFMISLIRAKTLTTMVFHGRSFLSIMTAPDPPLHNFNAPMATALELSRM